MELSGAARKDRSPGHQPSRFWRKVATVVAVAAGPLLLASTVLAYVDTVPTAPTPNPNENSVQDDCSPGTVAAFWQITGATKADGTPNTRSNGKYTITWTERPLDIDADAAVEYVLEIISVVEDASGAVVPYSEVFPFLGGNDPFEATFPIVQTSNIGTDALALTQGNGSNITHFGFCIFDAFGNLSIVKSVPTYVGGTFTIHYRCVLGGVVVAEGDVIYDAADVSANTLSTTISGIPSGTAGVTTACTISETINVADAGSYTIVLPATNPVILVTGQTVTATVTNTARNGTLTLVKAFSGTAGDPALFTLSAAGLYSD